ncbi:MAG: CBS domain-containing protein [Candidatus Binataceae bacterium]
MTLDDIDRALDEERPGPSGLESALAHDTLADVVHTPPVMLGPDASLAEAMELMRQHRRGHVLIVRDGKLEGIFTERDVLMKIAGKPIDVEHTPVSAYATREPMTLPPDAVVAFALNKMVLEGFRHIPLVDESDRPVGVVSMRNIIEYLADFFSRDVLNLPPTHAAARKRDGA